MSNSAKYMRYCTDFLTKLWCGSNFGFTDDPLKRLRSCCLLLVTQITGCLVLWLLHQKVFTEGSDPEVKSDCCLLRRVWHFG